MKFRISTTFSMDVADKCTLMGSHTEQKCDIYKNMWQFHEDLLSSEFHFNERQDNDQGNGMN